MRSDAADGGPPRPLPRPGRPDRTPARRRTARAALATIIALAIVALTACAGAAAPAPTPAPPIPSAGTAALTGSDVNAWLDGLVPAALERSGIAGAAVTVVHDGRVLAARGFGYADSGSGGEAPRPVDPDRTLFRVGSVSKVFVATAVLQLVEQGRIDLDTDISRYLDVDIPRSFDRPITMRHLLTHTAGFEERIKGLIRAGESTVNLRDEVAVEPPEQVFEPGTVPSYSNYGYTVAGYIVERVSGIPFDDYVTRNVLARAGMASSSFAQPLPAPLRDRLARGYTTSSGPAEPFETIGAAPAGALSASATDIARFMLNHLGAPGSGPPLLRQDTLALMHRPALDATTLGQLADGPRMTPGLFDESRNGHRIVGHGGDTSYFHSHLQMYPDDRTGVFVTLNSSGRGATDSLELRESVLHGFSDRYFPARASTTPPVTGTAAAHAAMAEGSYESARAPFSTFAEALNAVGQTTVAARPDGTVLISPGPGSQYPALYREVRPWVWQQVGGQRVVTMRPVGDRVEAIGFENAFTLLRTTGARDAGLALPVLLSSAVVLLIAVLAWPIGAWVRRRYSPPATAAAGRVGAAARILTRIGTGAAVLALAGWTATVATIIAGQDVPAALLHLLQAAQWVALTGIVPATVLLVLAVRDRAPRMQILRIALLVLALVGTAWFAVTFGLLSSSVSY